MALAGRLTPTIAVGRNLGCTRHGEIVTRRLNGALNFGRLESGAPLATWLPLPTGLVNPWPSVSLMMELVGLSVPEPSAVPMSQW